VETGAPRRSSSPRSAVHGPRVDGNYTVPAYNGTHDAVTDHRSTRPNVLFVCTDQQFAGALGCVTDDLDTPAMDSLAESGVRFENAYCTQPVCTPSRGSLLTGRMPHETGVTENRNAIPPDYRPESLGRLFREAGYESAYAGKWHLGGGMDLPPDAEYGHGFRRLAGFDDTALADACLDFFAEDRDRPFLLSVHFDNPHNICEWARNQPLPWGTVDRVPTEDCPNLPTNFPIPPFEPDPIQTGRREGSPMQDVPPEEWRHYRHAYYRLVERVDDSLGRILDGLDEHGLSEETVVVFTSDHGDGNGAHRLHQKWTLYEESVRIPLLVDAPDAAAGTVADELVSNGLDLLPTLCDYAGIEPPEGLPGRSLRELVETGTADGWRESLVTQAATLGGRMVRTDRYKYALYRQGRPQEQLFDLVDDPGETVNLAVEAEYADVLDEHRELLLEWCRETGDLFQEHYANPGVPTIPGYEYEQLRQYWDG